MLIPTIVIGMDLIFLPHFFFVHTRITSTRSTEYLCGVLGPSACSHDCQGLVTNYVSESLYVSANNDGLPF